MPTVKMTDQGHEQWRLSSENWEPTARDDLDAVIWGGERHVPLLATLPNCERRTLKIRTSAVGVEKASDNGSHQGKPGAQACDSL